MYSISYKKITIKVQHEYQTMKLDKSIVMKGVFKFMDNNDIKILRDLAAKYALAASDDVNHTNIILHRSVNDLKQIRPVVLIDELPWNELNIDNQLTLQCNDKYLREVEGYLRRTLFQWKYFPADMVVSPFVPINKVIHSTGIGIKVEEDTIATDKSNHIVSHAYKDMLKDEYDLEKLHSPMITYDEFETKRRFNQIGEIIGDIIPVKIVGSSINATLWDDISRLRGVTNLLIDLVDRPEFMHKIVGKLTDIFLDTVKQYEALNLFNASPLTVHCTPASISDLPGRDFDGEHVRASDVWGRGAAQIFASISPAMHDEFDITYMKRCMEPFGQTYYGCCEPLHNKIDIVEKLPNLRKISITPWADIDIAAEVIGKKYVVASKPNPANVAVHNIDKEVITKEINRILDACRRNQCSWDIVLKDISTLGHNPNNIFMWEKTVMELVRNY
jgi:hypothetical protein